MNKKELKNTNNGLVTQQILELTKNIKLLVCDIDGVMTNNIIYVDHNGEELRSFNVRDSYGIFCLKKFNIEVAVISGRYSKVVNYYCNTLNIKYIYQNKLNKVPILYEILNKTNLTVDHTAYIGDDLIDIPVMKLVKFSVAVSDAHPALFKIANYVTNYTGGNGAVREVCDLLLISQNKLVY
ncbi:MAG: 3-deoxy-manno-octulosonate-8-phosphatase KdsC [Candidatus Lightella neohaematopini]|nr:3-deoxy-manno-octulosonate-8-phosphatase KdsC [Candidatus Lightella neohaematopini]